MDKSIPREWIERIFHRMTEIYGIYFSDRLNGSDAIRELEITRWRNGLHGATADEIKRVIELCRIGVFRRPPNVIEFYHFCKGHNLPPIKGLSSKEDQNLASNIYAHLMREDKQ